MRKHSKICLALMSAMVLFGALAGSASARNLSISNQNIRATWSALNFIGSGRTITCPVTLEGSLHARTIAKVANTLIGYITRAIVGEGGCVNGTARVRGETLPWHVRYVSFAGTLPNITGISVDVQRPGFDVTGEFFGIRVTCSYRTSNVRGVFSREVGGALTNVRVEGRGLVTDNGFPCGEGELSGTSTTLTLLGAVTRLTVTLI
jgi:hypothetical protein